MERHKRRSLLVAKIGVATITYVVLASPIACNLPNPEPVPGPSDADKDTTDGSRTPASPELGNGDR